MPTTIQPAMSALRRYCGSFALLLSAATLGACGSALDALSTLPQSVANGLFGKNEPEEVKSYMSNWYWWRDQVDFNQGVSDLKTAEEALERFRYKDKDRFSYVEKYSTYNAFFVEGKTVAFGIRYKDDSDRITIRTVSSGSPAEAAGIKRGDAITAVDGTSVQTLNNEKRLSDAFGPSEVGITRSFTLVRGPQSQGQATELKVSKAEFSTRPVSIYKIQTTANGTKVGYIYFDSFINQTREQWRAALSDLSAQGASKLIVDLRYNGGGSVVSSQQLASSIAPTSADDKTYVTLTRNRFNQNSNKTYKFLADERIFSPTSIAFLVDKGTCSASEAMIQGLKPFAPIVTVGNTTCGKPVGFSPQYIANQTKVLSVADFATSNANGETDYFDGLTPSCKVDDDLSKALGDASEAINAAALYWLDAGVCPVGTQAPKSLQAKALGADANPIARSTLEWFGLK